MERIKNGVGFKGDLKSFFEHMRTDPKFKPFKTPVEVLNTFHNIHKTMEPNLKKMFGRTPGIPFEIRQTEAFRAASASAEYNPGTPDGKRPGIFYVPILDATKFNITSGMKLYLGIITRSLYKWKIRAFQNSGNLPGMVLTGRVGHCTVNL
jgi:uncharacterized protein (DUF885 family)